MLNWISSICICQAVIDVRSLTMQQTFRQILSCPKINSQESNKEKKNDIKREKWLIVRQKKIKTTAWEMTTRGEGRKIFAEESKMLWSGWLCYFGKRKMFLYYSNEAKLRKYKKHVFSVIVCNSFVCRKREYFASSAWKSS